MAELRAKKAGIGADIEKKLEARYDLEEAEGTTAAIVEWVNAVVAGDVADPSIEGSAQRQMHHSLRTGVKLCRLINALLESKSLPKVHLQKKANSMFVAYTNIENYNNGCLQYGLAKEFTVQSADLWEGRKGPFLNVVNNLHSLGSLANSHGFKPSYGGNVQKSISFE